MEKNYSQCRKNWDLKKKSQKRVQFPRVLFHCAVPVLFFENRWCIPTIWQYFTVNNPYLKEKVVVVILGQSFLSWLLSANTLMLGERGPPLTSWRFRFPRGPSWRSSWACLRQSWWGFWVEERDYWAVDSDDEWQWLSTELMAYMPNGLIKVKEKEGLTSHYQYVQYL